MSTIKEIAEQTGYSISTVSIVLRGQGDARSISKDTQAKIIDAAKDMGYTPNISARRLRKSDEKYTVVVYWPTDYRAGLVFRFLQGIYSYIEHISSKYEIIIYPYAPNALKNSATAMNLSSYSAAVVCAASNEDLEYLSSNRFVTPIVLYNRHLADYPCVMMDSYAMGQNAAEIMLAAGVERSVVVSSEQSYVFSQKRVDGFTDAYTAKGGHCRNILANPRDPESVCTALRSIDFSLADRIGVFCTTDHLVPGVYKYFQDAKHSIGERVKLVTIGTQDNEMFSALFSDIDTINIPIEEMGRCCIALIDRSMNGGDVEPKVYSVNYRAVK